MALEHVHGPAFMLRWADAQRAVLARAEAVAAGRRDGTLTRDELDELVTAQTDLDRYRQAYIRGTAPEPSTA